MRRLRTLRFGSGPCRQCGRRHNRDVNAAQNILQEGLRLLAGAKIQDFYRYGGTHWNLPKRLWKYLSGDCLAKNSLPLGMWSVKCLSFVKGDGRIYHGKELN